MGGEKSVMSVVQTKVPLCAFLISRKLGRKSHVGVQLHPCASFLHVGTRVKMCISTGDGESAQSPQLWVPIPASAHANQLSSSIPPEVPNLHQLRGDTGSVGVLEVLGLSYRLCVKWLLL